ncbi:hypothetical protein PPL_06417 [Heterostelium album PN500]|uniref:C3H1-type domain-containing protein n=1 Tax=Heterostelium pallidum (strain ATCC 26659 / Pp 5 / PN500) TaxID=670386 RepID=D3BD37_HETP5|nr:hypothetical protein PPL_06417 [Heterostelium album PN500]EFA80829.1 hypothetical protein PPL_06417 [Heterostelium album PN500]|eukprot:XP_020432948.1 hypothetical protein PPL_06417 [Heterostelium album PN500]
MTDFQQFSNSQIFGGSNSSNMMDPWSTQANSSIIWSSPSNFVQQPTFDPKKVPSSIKNSQFINISSVTAQDPWVSSAISLEKATILHQQQLKAKQEAAVTAAAAATSQVISTLASSSDDSIHQISQQFAQQQLSDDGSSNGDIEEEINGQSRYKTELCRSFAETGICRYGFKCQFAHGRDELRPVMRHPKYKTETCKTFHTVGSCPYGSRCRFIHSKPSPAEKLELAQEQAANSLATQQQIQQQIQQQQQQQQLSPPQPQQQQQSPPQPIKQNPLMLSKPIDLSAPINWTDSWGPDESVMPQASVIAQLKSTKEEPLQQQQDTSKRRLQIFRTICSSNPSWENKVICQHHLQTSDTYHTSLIDRRSSRSSSSRRKRSSRSRSSRREEL